MGPFTPEHDAVFVDVSLVPSPPQHVKPGILADLPAEPAGRRALGAFLTSAEPVVLAVLGGPGSGKTTLLRQAARQARLRRRSRRDRQYQTRDIPVLLYLRDHAAAIVAEPSVSVAALLRSTLGQAGTGEPPGWFEHQLKEGRCLVLLDGLDEVARPDDRVKVSAWAEAQVGQYSRSSFVISSRPQGYQSAPVDGAEIVQVCGFTRGQVADFVRAWYRAVERHSTGTAGPEAEALAADGASDLLRRLALTPALEDLTANPLLLTMIANVHRYRGALPGSRADLYSEICLVVLGRRQEAKRLDLLVSGDKKEAVLRVLAYAMMEGRDADLDRDRVLALIAPALLRVAPAVEPDVFLADVSSNGLLLERETGKYAFAHKTFQEYLAAAYIRDNGLVRVLAHAVNDDWWAETTLLYATKSNADPVIQACLAANSAPALALALDCIDEGGDVDSRLRDRVQAFALTGAAAAADPVSRRLFCAALLRRHMRQQVQTRGGARMCPRPVPSEIYRLFRADTMTPEPDAPATETELAVGMRGGDAKAFVRWANAVSGGRPAYRLPFAAELDELATRQNISALPSGRQPKVWTPANGTSTRPIPLLWAPPGADGFDRVSLADAVAADVEIFALTLSRISLLRSSLLAHGLAFVAGHVPYSGRRAGVSALDRILGRDASEPAIRRALQRDMHRDQARYEAVSEIRGLAAELPHTAAILADKCVGRLDRSLDRLVDLHLAPALDDVLARTLGWAIKCPFDTDLDRVRSLAVEVKRVRDLSHGLVLGGDGVLELVAALDAAGQGCIGLSSRHDRMQPLYAAAHGSVLGRAFGRASAGVSVSADKTAEWLIWFTAEFPGPPE